MTETGEAVGAPERAVAFGPAQRAALEAEREFLLASLRDLDTEREAGDLGDDQYEALRSRYTARAARVLRTLDALGLNNLEHEPTAGNGTRRRRAAVLVPLAATLAGGTLLLPSALSDREPGQTITGNQQTAGDDRATLEQAVADAPDDPAAHRAYARVLLDEGNLVGALKHYDHVSRLDPRDTESRAYAGWIVSLAGLPERALERIDAAIAIDPTYPDAHFFRGMVLRNTGDAAGAVTELRHFLELAPDTPLREQVEQVIAALGGGS